MTGVWEEIDCWKAD